METGMNESERTGRSKLNSFLEQGHLFAENCPIEFTKAIKLRIEEFAVNSQSEENRLRWRAISLGYNLSVNTRLKERELELKKKRKKSLFRKRSRGTQS